MSEDDKALIIGRLTLDYRAAVRHAAFIREELDQAVHSLDALLASIRPRTRLSPATGGKIELQGYASKYADLSKLLALIEEQDQTAKQASELRAKLEDLGA